MKKDPKKPLFTCVVDHKPGFFLNWLLYRLFRRVSFEESMKSSLREMHRQGTVVYSIKYRGGLDYLLYHFKFRRSRLPYPKIAFDMNMSMILPLSQLFRILSSQISYLLKHGRFPSPLKTGFIKEAIKQGDTALLTLIDPKEFSRHYIKEEKGYLHFLLETQQEMKRPIFLVPQIILYRSTPEKAHPNIIDIFFGFKDNPGFIRKIGLFFRYNRRAFIDFGTPVNMKEYLESQDPDRPLEDIATDLRQLLIEGIDRQKRVVLGPVMKSLQQFKETVLKDRDVVKAIEESAVGKKKGPRYQRKKAEEYFEEIAADFNITYVQFAHYMLTWLWKKMFQGIELEPDELAMVREQAREGSLVYIPSHKSHIDYLVLNYVLFHYHMHVPRVAAGKNLAFWPMGNIFRKSGAFFIRRTFRGARLYATVFKRYVKALLKEGHPLEFFIEGGRSRSGKLILPKIGFLSILLEAYKEGYCDDLIFVPSSISYDRIIEEKEYLREIGGGKKEKENFMQVVRARHFLKRKYGKIYIRFAAPVSLRQYLAQHRDLGEETHRPLALHLIRSINSVTLATPLSITATAILTKHRRGFQREELIETSRILYKFLDMYGVPTATSLLDFDQAISDSLTHLIGRKVVNHLEAVEESGTFYYVDDDKKPDLEYYKNSIIHNFIGHSFVAVSLLKGTDEIKPTDDILSDYLFMKTLFKYEFIYNEEKDPTEELDEINRFFLDEDYIKWNEGKKGFRMTRLGFDQLPIWAELARTFLESYWITTRSYLSGKQGKQVPEDSLKQMKYLGLRFHKLGIIQHIESVSQLTFKNAIKFFKKEIMIQALDTNDQGIPMEKIHEIGKRIYELSNYKD